MADLPVGCGLAVEIHEHLLELLGAAVGVFGREARRAVDEHHGQRLAAREIDDAANDSREADLIEQHDLAQARGRVDALLGRLNPRYATAIRLRVLEERSREEAAKQLEVSVATFDVVLHRAMAALKKALASDAGGS